MNGALVVLLAAAGTWLIIRGIRDFHNSNRQHRVDTSFLANHQRDIDYRRRQREVDESQVRWRP